MSYASVLRTFAALLALFAAASPAIAQVIFEDGFESCASLSTRSCYSGPAGTEGVGMCQAGMQTCLDGAWGPCTTEINPVFEGCNAIDDDCDTAIDEALGSVSCGTGACRQTVAACAAGNLALCTPGAPGFETCDGIDNDCDGAIDEDGCNCVHVAPTGNDVNPGTAASPKRNINAAIQTAATQGPNVVCVASGITCIGTANYDEAVVMRNGVHVYGGYQANGATWPRTPGCVTRIRAQDALGVLFDATVVAPTILDGFTVNAGAFATSAAITVRGSTGAVISDNIVTGGAGTTSVAVNVVDDAGTAATPSLVLNTISGGSGSTLSIGVRSLNSAPRIEGNCDALDAGGRCTTSCGGAAAPRSIRGRASGTTGTQTYGLRLESSPGALVSRSSICTGGTSTADAAGVRISGDAAGTTISSSTISGNAGQQNAAGVWLDACAGASPWIVDNASISSLSSTAGRADGVRVQGSCDARVERNVRIVGSAEGSTANGTGVFCGKDPGSGIASRCTITGNTEILGSGAGSPPSSTGVRCEDGACALIRGNARISGRGGQATTGLALGTGGTLVDSNLIQAGCATTTGVGLQAVDSHARIQNNRVEGVNNTGACTAATSHGMLLSLGAGSNEVDLHSNDLFGQIGGGACTSRGLALDLAGAAPSGGRGVIRNNIVSAGSCDTRFAVDELNAGADPRFLQNNDLWAPAPPTALYRNEASTNLTTIAAVNALGDTVAAGNISADPLYSGANTLTASSPCIDAGRNDGAPELDFQGDGRPQGPTCDIGRDELAP